MQIARSTTLDAVASNLKTPVFEGFEAPGRAGWHPCREPTQITLPGFTSPCSESTGHSAQGSEVVTIDVLNLLRLQADQVESPQNPRIAGSADSSSWVILGTSPSEPIHNFTLLGSAEAILSMNFL